MAKSLFNFSFLFLFFLSWLGKIAKSIFIFLFLSFRLLLRWSMGNIMWQSQSHKAVTKVIEMVTSWSCHTFIVISHSHRMWQRSQLMDIRTVGDKVHSHDSNCIYSVANLMETLSSSLCQTLNKETVSLIPVIRLWLLILFF